MIDVDVVAEREGVLAHGAVDVAAGVGDVGGAVRAGGELKRWEAAGRRQALRSRSRDGRQPSAA